MAKVYAWYDGNSMVVQLGTASAPLVDEISGVVQTGAVVVVRVQTLAGVDVAGSWPVAMPHATGGIYRATVGPLALTLRQTYVARITAMVGGNTAEWAVDVVAVPRRAP